MLLFFSVTVAAQEKCDAESAPALQNLRLGMSPADVRGVLGQNLKIKIKLKGQQTFFENFIKKPAPDSLSNIRAIYLRFFDGRLYQIEFFYEEESKWRTLEELVSDLSAKHGFPAAAWEIQYGIAEINCGEFSIIADYVLNPRIQITDEAVRAKVEELRSEK